MERIIAMIKEEKARLAEWEAQMAEDERRKREGERSAAARSEDRGINIMPVQNANDRT
jgi:hypothetical protein